MLHHMYGTKYGANGKGDDAVLAELNIGWTATGTHLGPLRGIPPTGRRVTMSFLEMFRIADGKLAEQWISLDTLTLLHQLEARHELSAQQVVHTADSAAGGPDGQPARTRGGNEVAPW
jgi:hypothetical protein